MNRPIDRAQAVQRLRVGATGLGLIVLLILAASAVLRSVNDEPPVAGVGAPNVGTIANMTGGATVTPTQRVDEPLAELGVAPGAATENAIVPTPVPPVDEQPPR